MKVEYRPCLCDGTLHGYLYIGDPGIRVPVIIVSLRVGRKCLTEIAEEVEASQEEVGDCKKQMIASGLHERALYDWEMLRLSVALARNEFVFLTRLQVHPVH